ncbi:MAG: stage II sporulation protein R [Lachnospiraceae bacterium]|nr:stage II sporulation protein R [Lachnospiraceae bacterium]MDD7176889.1 stage II sporulation protein R [bacterium]MDY5517693.1 stage II sporulation protein R [Lachnospiraceae bacterium]
MKLKIERSVLNRILFFICTLVLMAGCYSLAANYVKQQSVEAISAKVLRFHVIAKSDKEDDQRRKLLVRDAVGEWMNLKLVNAKDKSECERIIEENKEQIQAIAEQVLAQDGTPESVQVRLADVEFPDKVYGDYEFPAGTYRALQIIIGEGEGHNWWCVLYPNLCFSAEGYDVTGNGAKEELSKVLSPSEYEMLLKEHKYKLGFKYLKIR